MKELKAVLGAALLVVVMVVLPRMRLDSLPSEFLAPYGSAEVIINFLTVIGLILATLYVLKTLTSKSSPVNLVASIGAELTTFYSVLFFIGFGDPANFGRVEKMISMGADITLISDFRIFIQLLAVLLVIDVVLSLLEFNNSRSRNVAG